MGATNHTTNYELSQFIGTDKPSWLNDYNNDMLKIDTAVKANATAASGAQSTANTADGKADANALAIQTLNTQINTPDTGLAATVAAHTLDITGINSTIGTTPLTTVAQTLTGAIEEVKASVPSISNLLAFNGIKTFTVSADGVKTFSALMDELYTAFATYLASKSAGYYFQLARFTVSQRMDCTPDNISLNDSSFSGAVSGSAISLTAANTYIFTAYMVSSGSSMFLSLDGTNTDQSSEVMASGSISLYINEFTKN